MTMLSSSALKLLSLLLTLTAIAERGSLTHIDTILLGSGAVLFLMLIEAQQRAAAGESWSQAGAWLKALLGPSMLPFYALLFGALIAAPQGPPPRTAAPYPLSMPPSAYPYMSQRQPGMPGGQGVVPGSAGNPGAVPRPSVSGFGPPPGFPLPSKAGQPSTGPGRPSLQRPQQISQPAPAGTPTASPQATSLAAPGAASPATTSGAAPATSAAPGSPTSSATPATAPPQPK